MGREAHLDARQLAALLDNVAHGRWRQRSPDHASAAHAPEEGACLDLGSAQSSLQGAGGLVDHELVVLGPFGAELVGLGALQREHVAEILNPGQAKPSVAIGLHVPDVLPHRFRVAPNCRGRSQALHARTKFPRTE